MQISVAPWPWGVGQPTELRFQEAAQTTDMVFGCNSDHRYQLQEGLRPRYGSWQQHGLGHHYGFRLQHRPRKSAWPSVVTCVPGMTLAPQQGAAWSQVFHSSSCLSPSVGSSADCLLRIGGWTCGPGFWLFHHSPSGRGDEGWWAWAACSSTCALTFVLSGMFFLPQQAPSSIFKSFLTVRSHLSGRSPTALCK